MTIEQIYESLYFQNLRINEYIKIESEIEKILEQGYGMEKDQDPCLESKPVRIYRLFFFLAIVAVILCFVLDFEIDDIITNKISLSSMGFIFLGLIINGRIETSLNRIEKKRRNSLISLVKKQAGIKED